MQGGQSEQKTGSKERTSEVTTALNVTHKL